MMPMYFVDKFKSRPRRAVLQRPRCSPFPRPPVYSDNVTPEQLQQLLLLADCLVKGGEKPGLRKLLADKSTSSRGGESDSGRVAKQRRHRKFCPYHCVKADKEEEEHDSVAVSEREVASETHGDQKWATTIDCSAFNFKPTELKVQVDGDSVHVHGYHDERSGGTRSTLEMRRVIALPNDVSKDDLECVFSEDAGQLVLTAPRTPAQLKSLASSSPDSDRSPVTDASEKAAPENTTQTSAEAPKTTPATAESKRKCENLEEIDHDTEPKRRRTGDSDCKECTSRRQEAEAGETPEASAAEAACTANPEDSTPADTAGNCQESQTSTHDATTHPDNTVDTDATPPITRKDIDTSPKDSDVTAVTDVTRDTSEMTRCDETEAPALPDRDFSLAFHMEKFCPEDLEVKVVGKVMTLRGEREVQEDGFCAVEKMERKVTLPDSVDPDRLKCVFTNDGRLVVSAA